MMPSDRAFPAGPLPRIIDLVNSFRDGLLSPLYRRSGVLAVVGALMIAGAVFAKFGSPANAAP